MKLKPLTCKIQFDPSRPAVVKTRRCQCIVYGTATRAWRVEQCEKPATKIRELRSPAAKAPSFVGVCGTHFRAKKIGTPMQPEPWMEDLR